MSLVEIIEEEEVTELIRARCKACGGPKAFSDRLGVSYRGVKSILYMGISPSATIAKAMGFEKRTVYVKKGR